MHPDVAAAHNELVDRLIARGCLWSRPLVDAFRATPRHQFLDGGPNRHDDWDGYAELCLFLGQGDEYRRACHEMLTRFGVPHESRVMSAHRTPAIVSDYAAGAADRGLQVIIAGAGGAAHLPGMCAAKTTLPVLGVPVESKALKGIDSLLDPRNLTFADPQRLHFAVLPFGTAEVAAEIEEIILNVGQRIANDNVLDMQQSYANNRVRFVDAAIGGNACVKLRQSRPVAERRAAVIAGASVNPIEFHGGCPMRASWTARYRTLAVSKTRCSIQELDPRPSRPA